MHLNAVVGKGLAADVEDLRRRRPVQGVEVCLHQTPAPLTPPDLDGGLIQVVSPVPRALQLRVLASAVAGRDWPWAVQEGACRPADETRHRLRVTYLPHVKVGITTVAKCSEADGTEVGTAPAARQGSAARVVDKCLATVCTGTLEREKLVDHMIAQLLDLPLFLAHLDVPLHLCSHVDEVQAPLSVGQI